MEEIDDVCTNVWPQQCGLCGYVYDKSQWKMLMYVGVQAAIPAIELPELEMRNCSCGTTMGVFGESEDVPVVKGNK